MKLKASIFILSGIALSNQVFATNGYQLTGIGAYQKSLGGAVTAMPGSAMTAITNPAGISRIGKRADFSLEMFMPERFVDFSASGGARGDSASEQYGVPALGWTAPIEDNSDVFFGGGIYGTSGLGTDYPLTAIQPGVFFEGYSAIQFWQMAPTIAWNENKNLSFGISLNIDYQSVSFKQGVRANLDASPDGSAEATLTSFDLSRTAQTFGFGLSFGTIYDVNDKFTIGASYKSKQEFSDLEYQLSHGDIMDISGANQFPDCPGGICPAGTYKLELDFPAMYSIGAAFKLTKRVQLSLDVKQIEWSKTLNRLNIKGPNGELINLPANWDDQTIIAIGVEIALNPRLNLRFGYNQADAPFDAADTDNNYILPAITESHFAFGGDYQLGKFWELGFHGSKTKDETYTSPATGARIGLGITTLGINLGYLF